MRKKLKKHHGQKLKFKAIVARFGQKTASQGSPLPTILLRDIEILSTGERVTDHIWFTKEASWEGCESGCEVVFEAEVISYKKGYQGYRSHVYTTSARTDYKLESPRKITKVK